MCETIKPSIDTSCSVWNHSDGYHDIRGINVQITPGLIIETAGREITYLYDEGLLGVLIDPDQCKFVISFKRHGSIKTATYSSKSSRLFKTIQDIFIPAYTQNPSSY